MNCPLIHVHVKRCLKRLCSISYLQLKHLSTDSVVVPTEEQGQGQAPQSGLKRGKQVDLRKFPVDRIRNFGIIAHVDHGKSTLSDRLLEVTGTISKDDNVAQYLDKLQVEKERGITVKAQTVTIFHEFEGQTYLLNLVDTPGHVDFSYEVWRTLPACSGVLLIVDANSGVQAQTVAHFNHALFSELPLIPVINKIDLKNANPDAVADQMKTLFSIEPENILRVSAKTGTGIKELLEAIVKRIPPPKAKVENEMKALLFDSWFDKYKGVVALVALLDGQLEVGDEIQMASSANEAVYKVKDVGILNPLEVSTGILLAGQVGYLVMNVRDTQELKLGDILVPKGATNVGSTHLPKIPKSKPMVFAGIFPCDQSQTLGLKQALDKLVLTDPSVQIVHDSSPALGLGFRLGFLGLLHMEVFNQRLDQEFDAQTVITAPSVPYKVKIIGAKNIKLHGTDTLIVTNPMKLPDVNIIDEYFEPFVLGSIITPDQYLSHVTSLCMERRGEQKNSYYIDQTRLLMQFKFPLSEVIVDFYDVLKSLTSGYASFDYEDAGYETTSLVRLDILLNGAPVEELSQIVHSQRARLVGQRICLKLKETLPSQQFAIKIQAAIGGKIVGREDLKALRKDVTSKLYGGDRTRRTKLLERQKEGKSRMRMIGNIEVPRDTFIRVLKK